MKVRRGWRAVLLPAIPAIGLVVGLGLLWSGRREAANEVFALATLPVLAVLLGDILRGLVRGDAGLDLIAGLAMGSALAMGEPLAGVVVALMFAGGEFLEDSPGDAPGAR